MGEAGGEQPEIRRGVDGKFAVSVVGAGVEITNIKLSNHAAENNAAVCVRKGASVAVKGCDLCGEASVLEGGTLLLKDFRVHHCVGVGVSVRGIADIQNCVAEDGLANGIQVLATGKTTISDTKVHRNT